MRNSLHNSVVQEGSESDSATIMATLVTNKYYLMMSTVATIVGNRTKSHCNWLWARKSLNKCKSTCSRQSRLWPVSSLRLEAVPKHQACRVKLHSGSLFQPQPPSLLILLSEPGAERKVLAKETWFSLLRGWKSWKPLWEQFLPREQVLLSKNFHSTPGCRRKILSKEFWVGGGSRNWILIHPQRRRRRPV